MSINKNNNGSYKFISSLTTTKSYNNFNDFMSRLFGRGIIGNFLRKIKNFLKRCFSSYTIFDSFYLKYVGVFDGHNLKTLIKLLKNIKDSQNPTLLHVKTCKGKGFEKAEQDATIYHGIGKNLEISVHSFSSSVSEILLKQVEKHQNLVAITAGMKDGVGLNDFYLKYPNKVIDTGISEEYAVTLSGGLAISGSKPIVFMYSTFFQRAYDQILHDVCLQNLPVVFCIDRAGLVGSDGKTHQGVFDISYLSSIPSLTILSPKDVLEFEKMVDVALNLNKPVAIRYPNGQVNNVASLCEFNNLLKWEELSLGENVCILAVGSRMVDLALKVKDKVDGVAVINARTIKPLDKEMLFKYKNHKIITLEENVLQGGFGSLVLSYYAGQKIKADVTTLGVQDKFIEHASVESQLKSNGLTVENILKILQ